MNPQNLPPQMESLNVWKLLRQEPLTEWMENKKLAVMPITSTTSLINITQPPGTSNVSFGSLHGHDRSNNRCVYMIKPVYLCLNV